MSNNDVTQKILELIENGLKSPEDLMRYLLDFENWLINNHCLYLIEEINKLKMKYSKISFGNKRKN